MQKVDVSQITKADLFRYPDNGESEFRYFADPFPQMPDTSKYIQVFNGNFMLPLSDLAFIYYLPFFMEILRNHPESPKEMDVCHLWERIQELGSDVKIKYAELLDTADKLLESLEP